jgi:glycosyltransferase involved in cell wall biosynthesis
MINNLLNKSIFFLSDYFVVHTEDNKQKLLLNNIPDKSIFVIPLGASNKKIISKIEAKNYFKIDQNHKVILFFGNIRNYKGLDTLLEALGTINRNDISLLIGGSLWKNNWDLYESIIKKYNLEKNIIKKLEFIQPSEVGYFFSACDIVVCPYSYFDSQSGVASLALSYKKPLIVTNVGGLPDFVKDSRFIINPNDPLSLRNMILLAIDDNEILRKLEMESAELSEKYSWDNIAERTIEMYKQILDY